MEKYSLEEAKIGAESIVTESLQFSLDVLDEAEKGMVQEIIQGIDMSSSTAIASYGIASQNKVAQFSDGVLASVRNKDLGAVGKDLSSLVANIKDFDPETEPAKGLKGLFKNTKKKASTMIAQYSKVETNIDGIVRNLEKHQRGLQKDNAMLDQLFETNMDYLKELTLHIIAGKEGLAQFRQENIPQQEALVQQGADEVQVQKLNDMIDTANRFEKKLHDMKLTRMISIQMSPQIRLVQGNNISLSEQIHSSIVNAIPLWKNQMVIALGLAGTQKAMEANKQVTDMTNKLLEKNSELLKQSTIQAAEAAQAGIVSIDTVKKVNENLIETIHAVIDIQEKGTQSRKEAAVELEKIEADLKNTLIETSARHVR
ncbi:MAG: toxic anion resistance protein [Defluviitaleaceae bacterium]|nr:toxic anion resistance protein [Defluviitaleaceae bacterium]